MPLLPHAEPFPIQDNREDRRLCKTHLVQPHRVLIFGFRGDGMAENAHCGTWISLVFQNLFRFFRNWKWTKKLPATALIDATVDGKIACTFALVDARGIRKARFSSEVTDTSLSLEVLAAVSSEFSC